MASGVKVADDTVEMYKLMKIRKTNIRYLMMHIDQSDGLIKVECTQERKDDMSQEDEFKAFLERLPSDIGRYCIVDLTIPQKNGAMKDIMFLITWCPNTAPTKSHIMYTMSKKALTDKISEGMTEIQANDLSDLVYDELLAKGCK